MLFLSGYLVAPVVPDPAGSPADPEDTFGLTWAVFGVHTHIGKTRKLHYCDPTCGLSHGLFGHFLFADTILPKIELTQLFKRTQCDSPPTEFLASFTAQVPCRSSGHRLFQMYLVTGYQSSE
jgi:hypothetical protein